MKILQIHNEYKYFGGEDQIVERERNLLLENNHEVIQLIRKNNKEIKNLYDQIIVSKNLTFSKKSEKIVDEKIQFNKPDIVHIHNFFPLWSPSILNSCQKNKIPVVMSVHNYRLVCANGALYRNGKICELCPKNGLHNAIFHKCYQDSLIKTLPVVNLISIREQLKSKIDNEILNFFYKKYAKTIPLIGKYVVGTSHPYEYLINSIDQFYNQKQLIELMINNGFSNTEYRNLSNGLSAIHSGWKI